MVFASGQEVAPWGSNSADGLSAGSSSIRNVEFPRLEESVEPAHEASISASVAILLPRSRLGVRFRADGRARVGSSYGHCALADVTFGAKVLVCVRARAA